jgi:hypothetical protein
MKLYVNSYSILCKKNLWVFVEWKLLDQFYILSLQDYAKSEEDILFGFDYVMVEVSGLQS